MAERDLHPDRNLPQGKGFSNLKLLLGHLRPYTFQVVLASLSLLLAVSMVLSFGWALKGLIDDGFATEDMATLNLTIGIMVVAVIFLAIASFGRSYYVSWIGERVVTDLRLRVFKHLLHLDVGFFELIRPGELVSRLTTDTSLIQVVIGTSAAIAMRNFLLFVGGLIMMVVTSPKLTLLSLGIIPFVTIPIVIYGSRVRHLSHVTQDRIADLAGFIGEVLGSIRTTQAFMHEAPDIQNFRRTSERSFHASILRVRIRGWLTCLVLMLAFGGVSVILWFGGEDVISGKMLPGDLSAFIFYAVLVASAAGSFTEIHADLQRAAGAVERLEELMRTAPALLEATSPRSLPVPAQGTIAFHNVTFAYPSNPRRPVLQNVTFSAAPGEKIAIVGPSGAGKSTILSLLLQFYSPQSGAIYVDGIDMREASTADIRCRMGLVPQDPMIFTKSLYDNILYGRPDATEEEVWKAAEAAHLLEVIEDLPQGIHTIVGTRGIRLSGGQKQRIAIARAILRDPAVLLLDEATSALDTESEQLIQQSLKPLMATRTTIVIAHRLATVLKADRIIVMHKGVVQAVGTHGELISEDGLYRRLAMLQFTDAQESRRQPLKKILA